MAELATVARPYAKAMYNLAVEKNKSKEWADVLENLASVISNEEVRRSLSRPELSSEEQGDEFLKFVDDLAQSNSSFKIDEEVRNLIAVIAHNDRLFVLPQIAEQFRDLAFSENSVEKATIYSAYSLSDEQVVWVVKTIQEKKGVTIDPKVVVDKELIGGIKIEFGDQVLDLSIKNRLAQLYATMLN